jgi:hypothetical protein
VAATCKGGEQLYKAPTIVIRNASEGEELLKLVDDQREACPGLDRETALPSFSVSCLQ